MANGKWQTTQKWTSHATLYKLYRLYKPDLSSRSRKLFIKEYTVLGIFKNIHYGGFPQGMGKITKKITILPHSSARAHLSARFWLAFFRAGMRL
ncbi:hypothetical protein ACU8KH_05495 [Lachancea thermotolerans]